MRGTPFNRRGRWSRQSKKFLRELRRRKVYHVAAVYAAVAFAVWQVADIAFPSLGLSERAVGLVLAFTVLGFPIALVLAWAYEVRPEEPPPAEPAVTPVESTAGPAKPTNSVAILPFASMSVENEGEYFADGMTEEITNVLAGLADLHVASRTSAFAFKGTRADIRDIGHKLGVAYLVEGSVRRAGVPRYVSRRSSWTPSRDSISGRNASTDRRATCSRSRTRSPVKWPDAFRST